MEKSKDEITENVEQTRAHAREAFQNAGEVWSGRNAVASAWRSTKGSYYRAQEKVIDSAQATDETIRSNIYASIGIAFGVGAAIGFFMTNKPKGRAKNRKH